MTPAAYRHLIAELGLTQERAGEVFGYTGRTGQQWAKDGPPLSVAATLILAGGSRKKLDNALKKALA